MANGTAPRGMMVERIMRDRDGIWRQVVAEHQLGRMTLRMFATSVVSLAIYGAVLGASHSPMQAGSSAVKLPLLFIATLAICLPTLYLFNLIFGARLTMMQAITLIMTCITVMSVLALAFAPISLFFLITANNYEFFKLLNVAILVLSALVGLRFLTSGMAALNTYQQQQLAAEQAVLASPPELAAVPAQADGSRWGRGGGAAEGATRDRPGAGLRATAPAAGQHDAAVHLDPAVRVRGYPARLDPAPVLRQPRGAVPGLPPPGGHLLRGHLPHDRQPLQLTVPAPVRALRGGVSGRAGGPSRPAGRPA